MLKNLLTVAAILVLASCANKVKKSDSSESTEIQIEDKSTDQNNYQTLSDEQTAAEIDKQTQAKIQEVEVQDRVLFGYDSSELTEAAKAILDTQSDWLKSDASIKVIIEGHCDERGTREYNIALGEKRANSAKSYLISKGVDSSRIKVISYGKERLAFFGTGEESLAKNRRAVTVVQ